MPTGPGQARPGLNSDDRSLAETTLGPERLFPGRCNCRERVRDRSEAGRTRHLGRPVRRWPIPCGTTSHGCFPMVVEDSGWVGQGGTTDPGRSKGWRWVVRSCSSCRSGRSDPHRREDVVGDAVEGRDRCLRRGRRWTADRRDDGRQRRVSGCCRCARRRGRSVLPFAASSSTASATENPGGDRC